MLWPDTASQYLHHHQVALILHVGSSAASRRCAHRFLFVIWKLVVMMLDEREAEVDASAHMLAPGET
jgi:hypothetical protein